MSRKDNTKYRQVIGDIKLMWKLNAGTRCTARNRSANDHSNGGIWKVRRKRNRLEKRL